MRKIAALIPAAGEGTRLALGPKAFLEIAGKTLIARAVEAFLGQVDETVVAVPSTMMDRAKMLLGSQVNLVTGGKTRQESVYNLLQATEADIVLVHDAARPFLKHGVIAGILRAVEHTGAASLVLGVADTLIEAATGATVDRAPLRAVQTPQGFYRSLLLEAHRQGLQATDDAGLVRAMGHPVALVEGNSWLMKITTPADLEMAAALAACWDAREDLRA